MGQSNQHMPAYEREGQPEGEGNAFLQFIRANGSHWLVDYAQRTSVIEQEIAQRWRHAFQSFDLLVIVTQRALTRSDEAFYPAAVTRRDATYEALRPLAIRACQIAKEVRALMAKGYAVAASTRWRALHEVHVIARLIEMHGAPLAERYLRHDVVEKHKRANAVEKVFTGIGQPIPSAIMEAIASVRAEYTELQAVYADESTFFEGDYGWASGFVKGRTFADLEQAAGLADRRYAYRIVSGSIHGNIAGAFAGSITTRAGEALVLGPSSDGMLEPGVSVALSLLETEKIFLRNVLLHEDDRHSTIRRELALTVPALDTLFQEVVSAFQAVS